MHIRREFIFLLKDEKENVKDGGEGREGEDRWERLFLLKEGEERKGESMLGDDTTFIFTEGDR
jgi:hypothetical protein